MKETSGIPQIGIALGTLGVVLALLGLFPDITGAPTAAGFGVVQFVAVIVGYMLLIVGAIIYIKYTFYVARPSTLAQQIGLRLAWTGIVFSSIAGFADFLGFGSHIVGVAPAVYLGPIQSLGIIGGFLISSLGVLVYAVAGNPTRLP